MAARSRRVASGEVEPDFLRTSLGGVLRSWRRRQPGLTQQELSAKAGLPLNAVGDLERGVRAIKGKELKAIWRELGVSVPAFLEDVKLAQIKALQPGKDEGSDDAGSQPEEVQESTPAYLDGEPGAQGMVFYGYAKLGDLTTCLEAFGKFLRQNVPVTRGPVETDPEEQP